MTYLLLTLFALLLFSSVRIYREKNPERLFSLSLLRSMAGILFLVLAYFCFCYDPSFQTARIIFLSEILFAFIWLETACFMNPDSGTGKLPVRLSVMEIPLLALIGGTAFLYPCPLGTGDGQIIYHFNFCFFVSSLLLLLSMLSVSWNMEAFWRKLSLKERWEYKYLLAGAWLICGLFGWAAAYRFSYHRMNPGHFQLLAVLLLYAWLLMCYAAVRHRMFNRKIFVSRKVVYASVAPLIFGIYLIAIGIISLVINMFSLPFPFVLHWFLIVAGVVFICLMAVSGKVRHNIKYFISTHFYINKYEYRDEWLFFSRQLQGAITVTEITDALYRVLSESVYTNVIFIWLGDEEKGYDLMLHRGIAVRKKIRFSGAHPLVTYLRSDNYYYSKTSVPNLNIFEEEQGTENFPRHLPVLFVPMTIGERMVGIVGLGPEFTGGQYGKDDFDLLSALCTQTASAILTARMTETATKMKQQEAWDVMSAFILHDIKNAAAMLSLLRRNAPDNIHNPEFQQDMLETVDDALKRMDKVEKRMSVMKRDIVPVFREIELCKLLEDECRKTERRLQGLRVNVECDESTVIRSDPELLTRVIENILLNAFEAGDGSTLVNIRISDSENRLSIHIRDNGPGIPAELLPDRIFEPFYSTKSKGSGIGLWQARRLIHILGGEISVRNTESGGAVFLISLPAGDSGNQCRPDYPSDFIRHTQTSA